MHTSPPAILGDGLDRRFAVFLAQTLAEFDQEHRGLLGGHVQHRRARGQGSKVHC